MGSRSSGYTIIEALLFLAVSGLLLTVVLIGTGTQLYTTRFSDSSKSTEAFIQQQYDNILNGFNPRNGAESCTVVGGIPTVNPSPPTGQPAGASDCLFMGKLITFQKNSSVLKSYNILGAEPASPNYSLSDQELIFDYNPTIITNSGANTYTVPWQAKVMGSNRFVSGIADNTAVDALAFVRSPRSTNILTYVYKEPGSTGSYNFYNLVNPLLPADDSNFNTTKITSNFCFQSVDNQGSVSKIVLNGGQGQDSISLTFTVALPGDCDGI